MLSYESKIAFVLRWAEMEDCARFGTNIKRQTNFELTASSDDMLQWNSSWYAFILTETQSSIWEDEGVGTHPGTILKIRKAGAPSLFDEDSASHLVWFASHPRFWDKLLQTIIVHSMLRSSHKMTHLKRLDRKVFPWWLTELYWSVNVIQWCWASDSDYARRKRRFVQKFGRLVNSKVIIASTRGDTLSAGLMWFINIVVGNRQTCIKE